MLIKEYRIPLPLSVEEYQVAQLYMIAKKSRQESHGTGSGVEIIINDPYTDGPGGQGQYTRKIYHVGSHLPAWFKSLLPKSALTVEEEAWNAYPYTKTRYTCPFVERFSLEIETKYFDDCGQQDNVFGLSGSELRNRQVDLIDVVKDQLPIGDYLESEDPTIYVSEKSGRGPLSEDWIQESHGNIMCAYKLCKVEFRYWGMQTKIEKFIHDIALRKTMLRAHRQAWAWQDEWSGLTMEDVRRIEAETQAELAKKMAAASSCENLEDDEGPHSQQISGSRSVDLKAIDKDNEPVEVGDIKRDNHGSSTVHKPLSLCPSLEGTSSGKFRHKSGSRHTLHSPGGTSSIDLQVAGWRMEGIVRDSDSESDEFFDAEDMDDIPGVDGVPPHSPLAKWSSVEMVQQENTGDDSIFAPSHIRKTQTERAAQSHAQLDAGSVPTSPAASPGHQTHPSCPTSVLILILHGGNVLDHGVDQAQSKTTDVSTFNGILDQILRQHYPTLQGHIVSKLVACPAICADSLAVLSNLSPYSFQTSPSGIEGVGYSQEPLPIAALPLFAVSSPEYAECLGKTISAANSVYQEFLKSAEGLYFNGQVVLIGDSLGSILAFDALCRNNNSMGSHYGSETSINDGANNGLSFRANPLISISDGNCNEEEKKLLNTPATGNEVTAEHPTFFDAASFQKLLSTSQPTRRRSSSGSEGRFDFEASDLFMFGSPISLILTYRRYVSNDEKIVPLSKPPNTQVYNLFHPTDPLGLRIEPLISQKFSQMPPVTVPRFQKYPLGDGQPIHLLEYIQTHSHLFHEVLGTTPSGGAPGGAAGTSHSSSPLPGATSSSGHTSSGSSSHAQTAHTPTGSNVTPTSTGGNPPRRPSEVSISSTLSGLSESAVPLSTLQTLNQKWWGNKRIDYALYCPEGLVNFPSNCLPHLFHSSYWESSDVAAFVLRQLIRCDSIQQCLDHDTPTPSFVPGQPREKWVKKRTSVKIKNVTANHRANDIIVKEGCPQVLSSRFMYGPWDMVALTGEKVDIHIMKDMRTGEWTLLTTENTDKNGKVTYTVPEDKAMTFGMYPIKMVVRGDHTAVDFFLAVVPPKTEAVVFSIDGSFTASVSVSGKDPKVRAGAVDVVRHWQELGYLIIYITGRPDMQQRRVVSWLAQHNFPHGLVSFAEGLSTGPLKHKTDYLKHLQQEAEIVYHAAYGSAKDIGVYNALGIPPERTFISGKVAKKLHSQATVLSEGYAQHLTELRSPGMSRTAQGNGRMVLSRGCFGLPGLPRRRRSAKRTSSYPLAPKSPSPASRM